MIRSLLTSLTLILALAIVASADAAYPGKNGRIVYQVDQSIQSISPSGKDRTRLARGVADPSASPDGRHVLFTRDSGRNSARDDVWVMRADGSHAKRLTKGKAGDADPTFSPDGRRIAFGRDGAIWLMNADGGHERRLARQRGGLYRPSFAPNGRSLVADGAGTGLFEIGVRDGRISQLTDGRDFFADYSPDGRWLVFSAYRDTTETTELYLADADGSDVRRLTHDDHSDDSPVFSPDGKRIAFTHFTVSKPHGEDGDIEEEGSRLTLMDADGANVKRLAPGFAPSWAPKAR